LWIKWGMRPAAMIGHSIGEYVAACLAGVLSLADALALVAARGRLMQQLPGGSMLAVALPAEMVRQEIIDTDLSLAVINGPAQSVVAGPEQAVAAYEQQLAQNRSSARRLKTSHAFHSTMMGPILERFIGVLKDVKLNPPRIPFISNVTGTWITATQATDPQYWGSHLLRTVNFAAGVTELLKEEQLVLLEVGPGRTLRTLVKHQLNMATDQQVFSSLPSSSDRQSDLAVILETLGQSWLAGVKIEWPALYAAESRHRLPLPTYPFERKRYWIDQRLSADRGERSEPAPDQFGTETAVEGIMSQQLQIMAEQLDVLSAGSLEDRESIVERLASSPLSAGQ
jgi:acyl transferase domain-containing protein